MVWDCRGVFVKLQKKKGVVIVLSIVAVLGLGIVQIVGFDHYYEPTPIRIEIQAGDEKSFELNIRKSCTHEVGVEFRDTEGSGENIKRVFGESLSELNLPAKMEIVLVSSVSDVVWAEEDFGGRGLGFRYGPNPLKFIAGRVYLPVGRYRVSIRVTELGGDFSVLESYFFATHVPKTRCR